ncbi:MAG: COG4223 family protein [Tabrizicola sp.]
MTRRKDPPPEATVQPATTETVEPAAATLGAVESALAEPTPAAVADPLPPPTQPAQAPRSPGILGPILGGALAAVGGFALSHFNLLGLTAPDVSQELSAIESKVDALAAGQARSADALTAEVAALATRISALESAPGPAAPDLSRLDGLEQRLAAIEALPADGAGSTAALTAKLAEIERKLAALPAGGASAEVQQQLDAALARLDAAEAEAKARAAEAETAAATARRAAALDALAAAVGEGRPFAAELQALADPDLSAALGTVAETGVPTLAALQEGFPDPAREALRIARATSAEDGWTDRILDFLAAQTEARPLTPQPGTTPDAILSRAGFALSEGRVADALTELAALDPAVKAPLEAWIGAATAHVDAAAALRSARGE